jgi:hypothetical protein
MLQSATAAAYFRRIIIGFYAIKPAHSFIRATFVDGFACPLERLILSVNPVITQARRKPDAK